MCELEMSDTRERTTPMGVSRPSVFAGIGLLFGLFPLLFSIVYGWGAAKLSWCVSMGQGLPSGVAYFWCFMAWMFSAAYYPYYAFVYLPACPAPVVAAAALAGGRRRR